MPRPDSGGLGWQPIFVSLISSFSLASCLIRWQPTPAPIVQARISSRLRDLFLQRQAGAAAILTTEYVCRQTGSTGHSLIAPALRVRCSLATGRRPTEIWHVYNYHSQATMVQLLLTRRFRGRKMGEPERRGILIWNLTLRYCGNRLVTQIETGQRKKAPKTTSYSQ